MWIKLCGNTSLDDARLCAGAGASALGFIFAETSRRYVIPAKAATICRTLQIEFPQLERVGVFTHSTAAEMVAIAADCSLTAAQLQSRQTQAAAEELRSLAPQLLLIAAFPWAGSADFTDRLANEKVHRLFDRFLVDSASAHDTGGTGESFAWQEAASCFEDAASQGVPVILAGGLNAENVTAAVTCLHPFGVDAVSSLESSPGTKDAARIAAFVAAVRAASS